MSPRVYLNKREVAAISESLRCQEVIQQESERGLGMNKSAEQHLAKAKEYLTRGEQFYRMAAEQMLAAKNEGATWVEIGDKLGHSDEWAKRIASWHETPANDDTYTLPFSEEKGAVAKRHAKSVLRDATPEQVAEILDTPEVRANVTKALDTHYRERATKAAADRRERKVEDRGGEEAHVEHEHRQRLSELVNVMRGAVSALRFAASQAKGLDLASDDTGAAEELTELVEEIVGFGSMLQEYLAGRSITDEDIALLIGGK